jgi:aspartate aminotransferase
LDAETGSGISELRERIRKVTLGIVDLMAERERLVRELSKVKAAAGESPFNPEVERELRTVAMARAAELGLDADLVRRVLTLLLKRSTEVQTRSTGTQGLTHMDLMRLAKRMEKEGREVVHMEVGEPTLGAPEHVAAQLTEAALRGYAFYGEAQGLPELRSAIAEDLNERFGVDVKPEQVVVTQGGRFGIYLAMAATLSMGDEAIVIDPSWPHYKQVASMLGCRPIVHRTSLDGKWMPDPAGLEGVISDASRLLVLNYPNNPTGAVVPRALMEELVDVARRKKLYVLSDEVYMDYAFGGHVTALSTGYERTIMIMSFSKSWGMTGYRIGYAVAPVEVAERMARIQGSLLTCVPEFVQVAALKALSDRETPRAYREHMLRGIEVICKHLDAIGAEYVRPGGGMYVFPRIDLGGRDPMEFAMELLRKRGVGIAPGTVFGEYREFFRLSVGDSLEKLERGMAALVEEVRSLRNPQK